MKTFTAFQGLQRVHFYIICHDEIYAKISTLRFSIYAKSPNFDHLASLASLWLRVSAHHSVVTQNYFPANDDNIPVIH